VFVTVGDLSRPNSISIKWIDARNFRVPFV